MKNEVITEERRIFSLGELAEYINGRAFKPGEWNTTGLPIIRIQNLTNSSEHTNYYLGGYDERYRITNGDLLLAWSATLDIFEWNCGDALLNQHIFKVIPNEEIIYKRFYYYTLKNLIKTVKSQTHGSGMVHVTKPKLLSLKLAIPPLSEQQKIVNKLEKQMAQIEIMKKEAKEQMEAANNYFRSYLLKVFSEKHNWQYKKFGELFDTKYGLSKPSVRDSTKTKALRMTNISYEGELILDDICHLDLSNDELKQHKLKKNDLIFNRTNSADLVGKTTVFDLDDTYVSVSYLVVATPKTPEINSKFVSYYLNTSEMKKYFIENCDKAISQANFSASKLCEIQIPIPDKKTQDKIVGSIHIAKTELLKASEPIKLQIEAINRLPASILNEVFGQNQINS